MKQGIVILIAVLIAAAIAGGVGYSLGTENGLTQAQNIRTEFFQQRAAQFGQGTQGTPNTNTPTQFGQSGQGGNPAGTFGRGGVAGTVKSIDGKTIQLTAQDGSTIIVKVESNTAIQRLSPATLSDIRASSRITVTGDSSSGTLTARTIQIGAGGQ
jgi:hypothetical protein